MHHAPTSATQTRATLALQCVSKKFRAIVQIPSTNGAYVAEVVEAVRGEPAFWDFNNPTTSFTRLQVHGWATDAYTMVTGLSGVDTLVVNMEGMVE